MRTKHDANMITIKLCVYPNLARLNPTTTTSMVMYTSEVRLWLNIRSAIAKWIIITNLMIYLAASERE